MFQIWVEAGFFLVGWLIAYLSAVFDSFTALTIAALMVGTAGAIRFAKVLLRPAQYWSICNILAGAGLSTYCLGEFVTFVQYDADTVNLALFLGEGFSGKAFLATTYLGIFYWALVAVGTVEKKNWRDIFFAGQDQNAPHLDHEIESMVVIYLVVVPLVQMGLILTGGWTFQGLNTSGGELPLIPATVAMIAEPIPPVAGWILGRRHFYRKAVFPSIFAVACQLLWLAASGRRATAFGVAAFLVAYFWSRGKRSSLSTLLLAIPAAGIVYFVAMLFLTMRHTSVELHGVRDLMFLFDQAVNIAVNDTKFVHTLEVENYGSRFFIFQYLTVVVNDYTPYFAQYGTYLMIAVLANIPRAIFPNKTELFLHNDWLSDGKNNIVAALGLSPFDSNFSPFIQAYADFLWGGALVYPLMFGALGWLMSRVVRNIHYSVLTVGALGICLMHFMGIENTTGAFISTIRPLLFVLVFSVLLRWFHNNSKRLPLLRPSVENMKFRG